MERYHKIQSIYKRYQNGPDRGKFIEEDFSCPEFEYLFSNQWIGTEKIDGTNIRINWDGQKIEVKGRSDDAQIPAFLNEKLESIINDFKIKDFAPMTLYGEGYGAKIQKGGGNYIPDGVDFILFDVKIDKWWLKRDDVNDIARKLGIKSVPVVFRGRLDQAIEKVKIGFPSTIGNAQAEGLVLIPAVEMFSRNGDRIITKIKTKDRWVI